MKLLTTAAFALSATALSTTPALAHWDGGRPDAHAPIGVMGDHIHKKGEWMFSLRSMHMEMEGNRDGNDRISTSEVLDRFMVAPTKMTMDMQMLGAMYAPNSRLTLMAMLPYVKMEMDHVTRSGARFTTVAEGVGDVKLGGLYRIFEGSHGENGIGQHRVHLNFGISLPTGATDIRDDTIMPDIKLPYPMQIGSGTYDLMPGITYAGQQSGGVYSWGAQAMATIHTGENDEGYRRGDQYKLTGWVGRTLSSSTSVSIRLTGQVKEGIEGRDTDLNPMMVQTANPSLSGGKRLDAGLGLNFKLPGTKQRLAVEASWPVVQDLNGPQLETDWTLSAGWQWVL